MGLIVEIPSITAVTGTLLFSLGAVGSAMYLFLLYWEGKTSAFHNRSVPAKYVAIIYVVFGGFFALIYLLSFPEHVIPHINRCWLAGHVTWVSQYQTIEGCSEGKKCCKEI